VIGLTFIVTLAGYFGGPSQSAWITNRMPQQNDERIADDWESVALSRIAARVEALPVLPAEAEDFGWEASVLEKLRLRLNEVE